jgi:hypothetical protein
VKSYRIKRSRAFSVSINNRENEQCTERTKLKKKCERKVQEDKGVEKEEERKHVK